MKILITITFAFISTFAVGQNTGDLKDTKIGVNFTTNRKSNFSGFIGKNETTVFAIDYISISRKKQELFLRRFAKSSLELMESIDLFSLIDEDFYNEPDEIFYQDDQIYLFSTLNGLKQKYNLLYLEVFNQYGERLSGRVLDTMSVDEKYYVTESIEKEGFLLTTHNKFDNIFDQTIVLQALDKAGKTTWDAQLKSPISLQSLTIEEIAYSTESPLYILCDYGFESGNGSVRDNSTNLINNKYALWGYDHQNTFLKEMDLRIKNRWINGISLNYNAENELVVSGFMNETRNQTINGVFSLIINTDLTVKSSTYYKYKRAFFEKFVEPKRIDKIKELEDIKLRHCVVLDDDSYFLLGEHFYQYTERNYDPRTNITTTTENYNYNSIIAAYFDANGNHLWSDRIPKFQHTVNDYGYYSSFAVMQKGVEIYIFFNDTDKNNDIAANDYFNYSSLSQNRRFQISYVCVGPDGIKSRGAFIDSKNNFMLRARQCYQIDPDVFYLYGEVGKSRKVFSAAP